MRTLTYHVVGRPNQFVIKHLDNGNYEVSVRKANGETPFLFTNILPEDIEYLTDWLKDAKTNHWKES